MKKQAIAQKNLLYFKVPKLPFIVPNDVQFINIDYAELSDEIWELEGKDAKVCLEKIRQASKTTLKTYANCWAGAITGYDDALMFDIGADTTIEDDLLISVVRAEGCSRYGEAKPTKKIFYPYREVGEDTQIIPIDEIKNNYPLAYDYIMQYEKALKDRKDSRKTFGDRVGWYGLIRFGKLSRFRQEKIVSPGEVKHNKFCIDTTGSAFSCARVFSVNIENDEMNIRYLLAILNSKVSEFYLHKTTAVKAGGYYSYSSTALNALPVVLSKEYEKQIIDLSEEIMQKTKLGEDTEESERKIDEIVYTIYGLNDEDIKVIERELAG